MTQRRCLYVLDTNVLMHDPTALFRFAEHTVFLPMQVIEELDNAKKGHSEVSRNARQASRFLDSLLKTADLASIREGIPLRADSELKLNTQSQVGTLLFQLPALDHRSSQLDCLADNRIIAAALALQQQQHDRLVILISKDINLRIKATLFGLIAEDYVNDHALNDLNLLFSGTLDIHADQFSPSVYAQLLLFGHQGRADDLIDIAPPSPLYFNQYLFLASDPPAEFRVIERKPNGHFTLRRLESFRNRPRSAWGIVARNREQHAALDALLDPQIDFVTLLGTAGTGKTLLALAAGLVQTLDQPLYREVIMTRATVPVGDDIGFLPGSEEEKMTPWMGALTDNLEILTHPQEGGQWGRAVTNAFLMARIKIRSLNFMRGRTFLSRYLILDEAQNLTPKQMKTLITRAGPGTKIVCLGNVEQIDTPYLTETSSGLTVAVDRFKHWPHSAHITLRRGERSRLADYASEVF